MGSWCAYKKGDEYIKVDASLIKVLEQTWNSGFSTGMEKRNRLPPSSSLFAGGKEIAELLLEGNAVINTSAGT